MSSKLGVIVADFSTSLATAMAIGATTATLQSAVDDDGIALPAGTYYFAIDGNNSGKEHIQAVLSGSSLTSIQSVSRQGVLTSGVVRSHRVGATVTLTDFAHIKYINDLLKGSTGLDSSVPLKYDANFTPTLGQWMLATWDYIKSYVDGVAIAGAPDSTTTTKGISKMSVAPVSPTSPIAVGDNDTRVPTIAQTTALAGNNTDVAVGAGNKVVTQTGLQHNAERYAPDTSGSSTAYVVTLSPAPTSYTVGMVIYAKIVNSNTTTTPTLNANGLGAKTIVKSTSTALAVGDIAANSFNEFIYDGTNLVLQTPITVNYAAGKMTNPTGNTNVNVDTTITTGFLPRVIKLHYALTGYSGPNNYWVGEKGLALYTGTTLAARFTLWNNYSKLTGSAGNLDPTFINTDFVNTIDTTLPQAGDSSFGAGGVQVVLSILSVSSTGFVIRAAFTVATSPNTGIANVMWEATA